MGVQIPQPKLPHLALPAISGIPTIPHVGCAGADGTSYIGKKFGNLPDLHALLHLKTLQKALNEQVYALIEGELPDALRPVPYAARAAQLTNEIADLVNAVTSIVTDLTDNINDAINYADQQIAAVNEAKNMIAGVPEGARSAVQKLMFERYGRYASELNAQKARLQSAITCIGS
jgi:hypothetical protein